MIGTLILLGPSSSGIESDTLDVTAETSVGVGTLFGAGGGSSTKDGWGTASTTVSGRAGSGTGFRDGLDCGKGCGEDSVLEN